jgi:hypothetical protein
MAGAADVLGWIARRRKAGWGEGERGTYKPWLTVRSFGSRGTAHRVLSRHGRTYHFVSTREYNCFLLLEWSDLVVDVREQYPLHDMSETQEIAATLGFAYPTQRRRIGGREGRRAEPMTTDFLVSLADVPGVPPRVALSVKTADALEKQPHELDRSDCDRFEVDRLLEKAEMERRYWARRGVPFRMVSDHEMPAVLIHNLDLVLPARNLDGFPFQTDEVPGLLAYLYDQLAGAPTVPLAQVCAAADTHLRLSRGAALALVWHALGTKRWVVDMTERLDPDRPLRALAPGLATDGSVGAGWAA